MQLRDSSSRSATDGADQHTRCGKGEKKTIAPETNSSGQPAPDLEEVCGFSVSNKKFFFKNILALQRKPVVSRARARFDYVASPDDPSELSFKRGEIGIVPSNFVRSCDRKLDSRCQAKAVLDDSGKWWEVRKACGWEGLAPSNYLRRLVTPGVLAEAL